MFIPKDKMYSIKNCSSIKLAQNVKKQICMLELTLNRPLSNKYLFLKYGWLTENYKSDISEFNSFHVVLELPSKEDDYVNRKLIYHLDNQISPDVVIGNVEYNSDVSILIGLKSMNEEKFLKKKYYSLRIAGVDITRALCPIYSVGTCPKYSAIYSVKDNMQEQPRVSAFYSGYIPNKM
jgi:hypothetical protein